MAEVMTRDEALIIAIHLLRFEMRRPDLLALAESLMDKYGFSPTDRNLLAASIRSHNWLSQYMVEQRVPANLQTRDAYVADLIGRAVERLVQTKKDILEAKTQTARLRGLPEEPPDAKQGGQ